MEFSKSFVRGLRQDDRLVLGRDERRTLVMKTVLDALARETEAQRNLVLHLMRSGR